jgi:hypothetical protein
MAIQISAIAIAPIEIWIEIFDYLLYDPIFFSTDPFYPGCNYQIALEEWQNESRLTESKRQRGILRLVSRAWKDVVDLQGDRFYQVLIGDVDIDAVQIHSVKRLHVGWEDNSCDDPIHSTLTDKSHSFNVPAGFSAILRQILTSPESSITTLVLPDKIWARIADPLFIQTSAQILPGVKALEVEGGLDLTISVSSVCPNLTFLNIHILNNILSNTEANFPDLTTLILASRATNFDGVINWAMPNLRHTELKDLTREREPTLLYFFLARTWPNLISLKVQAMINTLVLPGVIWDRLPKLVFLGMSWLSDDAPSPPDGHPIHTVANVENEYAGNARGRLFHIIRHWKGLKTLSDIHRWEELPRPIDHSCLVVESNRRRDRCHAGNCSRCIENAAYLCYVRGLRYEDRLGRSMTEYLEPTATCPADN